MNFPFKCSQQVEPKFNLRKKTPSTIISLFFNDFKQVKIILKFWGHVSRTIFEILPFKKPNFEPKFQVKVRYLVVLDIFFSLLYKYLKNSSGNIPSKFPHDLFLSFGIEKYQNLCWRSFLGMGLSWTYCVFKRSKTANYC